MNLHAFVQNDCPNQYDALGRKKCKRTGPWTTTYEWRYSHFDMGPADLDCNCYADAVRMRTAPGIETSRRIVCKGFIIIVVTPGVPVIVPICKVVKKCTKCTIEEEDVRKEPGKVTIDLANAPRGTYTPREGVLPGEEESAECQAYCEQTWNGSGWHGRPLPEIQPW